MRTKSYLKLLFCIALSLSLLCGCGQNTGVSDFSDLEGEKLQIWGAQESPSPSPQEIEAAPASAAPSPEITQAPQETPAVTAAPAETSSGQNEADPVLAEAQAILERLSTEEKVAQLFVVTPEALTEYSGTVVAAGQTTRESFEAYPVGGIVYLGDNLQSYEQTQAMLTGMQEISMARIGLPAFLCVDEEGGTVARVSGTGNFGISAYPDMSDVGASGDIAWAAQIGREMGEYLSDLGFNVDFAPVADVLTNPANTVVKYRSFGSDPETVAEMTAAFTAGLSEYGVLGCYKHFPGHGGTAADSHNGFAYSEATMDDLWSADLIPFQRGAAEQVPFIMVGHISLPNATGDDLPASLSETLMTRVLREQIGYEGVIITDALNMGAISQYYTSAEASIQSFLAGADMLLMPSNFRAAYDGVLSAVERGEISQERLDASVLRIIQQKLRMAQ